MKNSNFFSARPWPRPSHLGPQSLRDGHRSPPDAAAGEHQHTQLAPLAWRRCADQGCRQGQLNCDRRSRPQIRAPIDGRPHELGAASVDRGWSASITGRAQLARTVRKNIIFILTINSNFQFQNMLISIFNSPCPPLHRFSAQRERLGQERR